MHPVSGRVLAISVRAAIIAGSWTGFALGLVAGCVLGASLAWFAGATLVAGALAVRAYLTGT